MQYILENSLILMAVDFIEKENICALNEFKQEQKVSLCSMKISYV